MVALLRTFALPVLMLLPAVSAAKVDPGPQDAADDSDTEEGADAPVKAEKKAEWAKRAAELGLNKPALVSAILVGKIPKKVQEAAGGFMRPKYFKWPVPGGRFGRGFGSGKDGKHKALDIVAKTGTPVLAATYGLVVWVGPKKGYGKTVVILHPGGWATLYAHLSKYCVNAGMLVKARQKIAAVGSTGISRGPHLHFMWFDNGVLRDPAPLMHPNIPHPPHVPPMPFMGHTVKKGQTPAEIADLYGVEVEALLAANGMKPSESFMAGWRIIIPAKISQKKFDKGFYTVKKGDTIAAIAVLYDVSVKELKALNDIKDENKISPGMKVKLPEGTFSGKALKSIGGPDDEEVQKGFESYTVSEGDSLFTIAKKFDTSITKIADLNGIKDPDKIKPGAKILVPAKEKKKPKKGSSKKGKKGKAGAGGEAAVAPGEGVTPVKPEFTPVTEEELNLKNVEGFSDEEVKVLEADEGEE